MTDKNFTITAHCLVKNEENFIWYAIKSVIDFVDQVIVFDTGSTDKTIEMVKELQQEYPDKIIFEEKGECDKKGHTDLRQEMIEKTRTDWFIILDGDEIWTKNGIEEIVSIINNNSNVECLIASFYLCVGDIFHYSKKGFYNILGRQGHFSPKIYKKLPGIHWSGDYGKGDAIFNADKEIFINNGNSVFLQNRYWHTSSLIRSPKDAEIKLGRHKEVMTYSLKFAGMGFEIPKEEELPEVFKDINDPVLARMPLFQSWINLFKFIFKKCLKYFA